MSELLQFISKVKDFKKLDAGNQIKYFVFHLQVEKEFPAVKAKDIQSCFELLHLNPYSNIPTYLNRLSKKGKTQQFIKRKDGFVLLSTLKESIEVELQVTVELKPSNSLFPISIFNNTRGYLVEYSTEASCCYDYGLYNSCLFLIRKITETLIIELYESKGLHSKIRNTNNDYFQLSELIKAVTNEPTWKLSKIVKENLPKIKLLADSSVHSKRFSAKKPDIDDLKTNTRITFEEFINLIDYQKWNSSK